MNHGQEFWDLVGEQMPDYKSLAGELRALDKKGHATLIK